ncbi:MAG: FecR family protein, partial [Bacteroidales bacterium]|nr:FecR family protein [Bacteroidales bacterium]
LGYLLKVQFMASPQIEWVEVTTGNETKNIILADQSKIFLNKNSTLKYPSEFSKKERLIQFSGEAYFEITHQQKKPFIVNTKHETVTVLGTTFNVRAYDEDINTNVLVTSGKVQFTSKSNNKNLILTKGNKGIYNRSTGGMKKVQNSSFNEVAWHTKNLEFKDTPFFDVIEAIESLYDIQFEVSDSSKYEDCIFTSNFKNATLTEVLETVSTVLDIEFRASSDSLYQIKGGTCE